MNEPRGRIALTRISLMGDENTRYRSQLAYRVPDCSVITPPNFGNHTIMHLDPRGFSLQTCVEFPTAMFRSRGIHQVFWFMSRDTRDMVILKDGVVIYSDRLDKLQSVK